MGQYVQAGICYRIKVSKREIERNKVTYEEAIEGLAREVSVDLYEIREVETGYIFSLKDEVLEKGQQPEFLTEQYKLFNADEVKAGEIIDKLKGLNKADDIIEFGKQKKYQNFQYSSVYDNIYCGICLERLIVEYELITFMLEGKIIMEGNNKFLKYIESLIKRNNPYKISEIVKVLIG